MRNDLDKLLALLKRARGIVGGEACAEMTRVALDALLARAALEGE